MFCKYCGKTLKDGSKFCKYCGKEIGKNAMAEPKKTVPVQPVASPVQPPVQPSTPLMQTKPEEKPKKRLRTGAIIGIILGSVAIVAVAIVFVLTLGVKPPSRDAALIQQTQETTQAPVQEQSKIVEESVKTGNEQSENSDEVKVTKSDFYGEWLFVATRFDIDNENDPVNNEEEGYGYLIIGRGYMKVGYIDKEGKVVYEGVSWYVFKYDETLKNDERFNNTSYSYFIEDGVEEYRYFIDRDGYMVLCQFEDNKYFGNVQIFEKQPEGTIEGLKNK